MQRRPWTKWSVCSWSVSWGLAYLLLAQLVLSGFAAGAAMAARAQADAPAICTGLSEGPAQQDQAPHRAPHCLLCPQAGHTPFLPTAPGLPTPVSVYGAATVVVPQPAEPRLWAIREGARTRAPPAILRAA